MTNISTLPSYMRLLRDTNGVRELQNDLNRQLTTGKKSETLSGLGLDAARSVDLRDQQARIGAYQKNIDLVQTRTEVMDTTMRRIGTLVDNVMSDLIRLDGTAFQDPTIVKQNARNALSQIQGLLNTKVEGRYLFAGSDLDNAPIRDFDQLLASFGSFYGDYQDALYAPKSVELAAGAPAAGAAFSVTVGGVTFNTTQGAPGVPDPTNPLAPTPAALTTNEEILEDLRRRILTAPEFANHTITVDDSDTVTGAGANSRVRLVITPPAETALQVSVTGTGMSVQGPAVDFDQDGVADDFDDGLEANDGNVAGFNTARYAFTGNTAADVATLSAAMNRVVFDPAFAYDEDTAQIAGRPRIEAGNLFSGTLRYGTSPTTARVDDNVDLNYGVRADSSYFRRIIQGLAMVATLENPPITDPTTPEGRLPRDRYLGVVGAAKDLLKQGRTDLDGSVSYLGSVRSQLSQLEEKHRTVLGVVGDGLERVEDADIAAVATRLNLVDTQLQAGYRAIGTLNQVSILNFLT